jgi:alpha-mannosidase
MPNFIHYTKGHLADLLNRIQEKIYTEIDTLKIHGWCTKEPLPFEKRLEGTAGEFQPGDKWGNLFDCGWFLLTGKVPEHAAGQHVVLLIDFNSEACVFDHQGTPILGLTGTNSGYDFNLGKPGKHVFQFAQNARGGEDVAVWVEGGCNDLFGNLLEDGRIKQASIAICNDALRTLFFDFEVLHDFLKVLPPDSARCHQILRALKDAAHVLNRFDTTEVQQARKIIAPMLEKRGGDPSLSVSAVGHAHMDLGWLWPIRETIRKGARTFSTVLDLIERYPNYIFGASQPQYFWWMKTYYPELYRKIKAQVLAGRIEPQGAMWVEADTNVSGGEALVRQILQGKRFFKQEFGVEMNYLWLPDVFGYSATLPQLLKKSGVDFFLTQKLSWNLVNAFPHHSFYWQGIDGSSVLAHMFAESTYNSPAAPRSVWEIERNYRDKDLSEQALMVYGIGDGGGGPGAEHLERLQRIENLAGLCPVKQESVANFLQKWVKDAARFPRWVGELYLERHQGTLTTNARNKFYNRKIELGLRELEWTAVTAKLFIDIPYPAERLETIWREVLLYQFHDILPGSSIKRVYDESVARYQALDAEIQEKLAEYERALAAKINTKDKAKPYLLANSLSWPRQEWIKRENCWQFVNVPEMAHVVIDWDGPWLETFSVAVSATELENNLLKIRFNPDGSIASIWDKEFSREIIPSGTAANRLAVYPDRGDAWDFPLDYAEIAPQFMQLISAEALLDGPQATLKQVYQFGHSKLTQEIILFESSRRIDFRTHLTWRETATMLRTSFPVNILADEATFEIQYGFLRRPTHQNTTWDLARDEVAAQKWVDLSQEDYGVALLNNSKYGHKIKGNVLDLNLLRSVPYPGPRLVADRDVQPGEPHHAFTDQFDHEFTYALFPHTGNHWVGRVVNVGYELNVPLQVTPMAPGQAGDLKVQMPLLTLDVPNIIVEAVKKAEDSDDLIFRLYETDRRKTRATVDFWIPIKSFVETNLIEVPLGDPIAAGFGQLVLDFEPFEIKTLKVTV